MDDDPEISYKLMKEVTGVVPSERSTKAIRLLHACHRTQHLDFLRLSFDACIFG